MKVLTSLTVLLMFVSMVVYTQDSRPVEQPNDPFLNPDANACYEGGTLAGQCPMDLNQDGVVDDFEDLWSWEFGWYLIRCQAGMRNHFCSTSMHPVLPPFIIVSPTVSASAVAPTVTPDVHTHRDVYTVANINRHSPHHDVYTIANINRHSPHHDVYAVANTNPHSYTLNSYGQ